MANKQIHILHLTSRWLRWTTLQRRRRRLVFMAQGTLEGEPPALLDRWTDEHPAVEQDEIYLFDGRPMYYGFMARVPARARAQKNNIIGLKIKQELGLDRAQVCWSALAETGGKPADQQEYYTVVARREALADLADWQRRRQLQQLWVGADTAAIRGLAVGRTDQVVILNADECGLTWYQPQDGGGRIAKGRVERRAALNGELARLELGPSVARAMFGHHLNIGDLSHFPALNKLPPAPLTEERGAGSLRHVDITAESAEFDPVIYGALVLLGEDQMAMPSLLANDDTASNLHPLARALKVDLFLNNQERFRLLVLLAVSGLLLLSAALWGIGRQRESARERLVQRAESLASRTRILVSQENTLRKIKADRSPVIPLIEAIHKAAPQGVTLTTLHIGETGVLQIAGTAPNPETPNQFFKDLNGAKLFDPVQLPEVKKDARGQGATFQLTAQIKGRGKK